MALRREPVTEEDAAPRVALDQVDEEAGVFEPTLPQVLDALLHPCEEMVAGVSAAGPAEFAAAAHEVARALQRLCEVTYALRGRRSTPWDGLRIHRTGQPRSRIQEVAFIQAMPVLASTSNGVAGRITSDSGGTA